MFCSSSDFSKAFFQTRPEADFNSRPRKFIVSSSSSRDCLVHLAGINAQRNKRTVLQHAQKHSYLTLYLIFIYTFAVFKKYACTLPYRYFYTQYFSVVLFSLDGCKALKHIAVENEFPTIKRLL